MAAMARILSSRAWSRPQRQWLQRIGKHLKVETVVDREALDRDQFGEQGGFTRLNRVFDRQRDQVLGEDNAAIWEDVA